MDIRALISSFTQSVASLPAEEQTVLGDLAQRMANLSDREVGEALASSGRGVAIRSGIRAGLTESE